MTEGNDTPDQVRDRGGRPAATSPRELAEAAQRLFLAHGFDQTSVDDIAAAAGVSRRTFFRYFPTKADVLWVETSAEIDRLRAHLAASGDDEPYPDAVTGAVLASLRLAPEQREWALQRAQLIFTVPAVQGQAAQRFVEWRTIAAGFAARRYGQPVDALFPLAVGHAVLAASLTAHEYWITHPESDLADALATALALLLPPAPADE